MPRRRITAAQRKHLAQLRESGTGAHFRLGGMMIVPGIATPEAWEAEATVSQARLMADARDDPREHVVAEPEPVMSAEQERTFAHQLHSSRWTGKPVDERAEQAYRKALGIVR